MEHKTNRTNETHTDRLDYDFGVVDDKGRAVGASVHLGTVTYVTIDEPDPVRWYSHAPGTYYTMQVQATRGGESFGATQATHTFESEAERTKAIRRYIRSATKRAERKWARG